MERNDYEEEYKMADRKKINSKLKGSEFERKTAKALSSWWGESFTRTPASGGLRWGSDNRVAGDIVCPPESLYPFTTECKKHEDWSLEQVLKGTGNVEKWWTQSVNDGLRVDRKPVVIFSKNFAPSYLMINENDFNNIMEYKGGAVPFNYFGIRIVGKEPRIVCNLEDFMKHVTKDDIINTFKLG